MRQVLAVIAVGVLSAVPASAAGPAPTISRVSESTSGIQGDAVTTEVAISGNGRYVAFVSTAGNLVAGDTGGDPDVFVRDLRTGVVRRVPASTGAEHLAISHDGRWVAFGSAAPGLVPGDTNGVADVFVRDRTAGTTRRISVSSAERQGNGPSSVGLGAISSNGRYVAFTSAASNLVPGDTVQGEDAFVRDLKSGTTGRVSVSSAERQGNGPGSGYGVAVISGDGRYVGFISDASNLVPNDTNQAEDAFVRDRKSGTTGRISVSSAGRQGDRRSIDLAISADGRYAGFASWASGLVPGDTNDSYDIFVRDLRAHTTERVSVTSTGGEASASSYGVTLSADGRYVVFQTPSPGMVPGPGADTNETYRRDRRAATTTRVTGQPGNSYSYGGSVSADGRSVAFVSNATNLVPHDTNGEVDAFVSVR
jgi:archaellum component FlaF (FlaF/FlaG flagellin family)